MWSLVRGSRFVLDGDLAEAQTARFATRTEADAEIERHELAHVDQVDGELAQQRRVVPDVAERQAGELAAPAQRQRNAAQDGQDLVAAVESSGEAHVAASPHAVDRLHAFRLAQYLLEAHLRAQLILTLLPYRYRPSQSP